MFLRPIASIDIGTNSFHMIIAKKNDNQQIEILDREKIIVRLGEGSGDYDFISKEAEDRAIEALKNFKEIARKYKATIQAVATSAVREAKNQEDFLKRVKREVNINVKVISGAEEGRLIYLGVLRAIPAYDKNVLLIDIGGGSTEILLGNSGKPIFIRSLKLGAVRLTEKYFKNGILTSSKLQEAKKFIENFIYDVYLEYQQQGIPYDIVIGSSGTVKTLNELIHQNKKDFFLKKEFDQILEIILNYDTTSKRKKKLGIEEYRADILPAGALILNSFLEIFGIQKIHYSPYALREGVLFELLFRKNKRLELEDLRKQSCINLLKKFCQEVPEKTKNISLKILRELGKLYPELLGEKHILEYASLLHNIGISISHSGHHKHSYYIIKNTEYLLGFTNQELELIACVARYHRKASPSLKHPEFLILKESEKNLVEFFSGILRIAIGLTRTGIEPNIKMEFENKEVKFYVYTKNIEEAKLIIEMAELRKDLLEQKLNKKIHFIASSRF
ncbi:MAG: Ppx/GppA phosphatase family protein [Leptonema sp. (in: bacteria)]